MAINPNIALNTRGGLDYSKGINQLSGAIKLNRLNERQTKIDEQNKTSQDILNEKNQLLIDDARKKIEREGKTQTLKEWGRDLTSVNLLIESGNTDIAKNQLLRRRDRLASEGIDVSDTEELINLMDANPEGAKAYIDSELTGLHQLGFFKSGNSKTSAKTETYKNGTVMFARDDGTSGVLNPLGKEVYGAERVRVLQEANEAEALKSQSEVDQIVELEKLKSVAKIDPVKRQKEIEALQTNIESGKLKVAEGEKQKEKAGKLKGEVKRLVSELLNDPDSVRAVVGPFDQSFLSPTLFSGALKTQTKINQLRSILTAENLGIMSGVLSESDIKIIAAIAGGGLDPEGSDDAFIEELQRMNQSFNNPVDSDLSAEDQQALQWAKDNPNDPRSAQILNTLGVQ